MSFDRKSVRGRERGEERVRNVCLIQELCAAGSLFIFPRQSHDQAINSPVFLFAQHLLNNSIITNCSFRGCTFFHISPLFSMLYVAYQEFQIVFAVILNVIILANQTASTFFIIIYLNVVLSTSIWCRYSRAGSNPNCAVFFLSAPFSSHRRIPLVILAFSCHTSI